MWVGAGEEERRVNYYNENDPKSAAWLRELIKSKLIPEGFVDERSIVEVQPEDLKNYVQCHFFAGIGGWSLALKLAGWPEDERVWTGSCPCQPFSVAGKGLGTNDARHLWPEFRRLIEGFKSIQPLPEIFGEQVASATGRQWLNGIRADLEELGYVVGAADLCSASVNAPHIRQRLFWVANSGRNECVRRDSLGAAIGINEGTAEACEGERSERKWSVNVATDGGSIGTSGGIANCRLAESKVEQPYQNRDAGSGRRKSSNCGRMGDADDEGSQGWSYQFKHVNDSERREDSQRFAFAPGFWNSFDLIPCADGKTRRIEPGTFPLVAGISKGMVRSGDKSAPINPQASPEARITRLRGYGNAIVPELAAEFIRACMDVTDMPGKPEVQLADNEAAQEIARSMVGLNLTPGDPQSWVAAVRHARAEYPSQATIEAAVVELKRLTRPAIHLVTRRGSHQLRRRVK